MRRILLVVPVFVLLLLHHDVQAQKEYQGTMVTKFGTEQTGLISVDLDGSNSELIKITTVEETKNKDKSSKTKKNNSSFMKLSVALIKYIIINQTTYYFRDVKYDYSSKYYMNCCVRLVDGNLDCGIFQRGQSTGQENIYVKLPNDEFSKLIDIDFDYYKATQGWHIMAFSGCTTLKKKMSANDPGYKWDDATSRDDRIVMWENWVAEFNACK